MSATQITPILPETSVVTTQANPHLTDEWTVEEKTRRIWGAQGHVIAHHDSHGLCYEIRHSDESVGCYDSSEFRILKKSSSWDKMNTMKQNLVLGQKLPGWPYKEELPIDRSLEILYEIILEDSQTEAVYLDLSTQYRNEGIRWRSSSGSKTWDKTSVAAWRQTT